MGRCDIGGEGRCTVGGWLNTSLGLFGLAVSYKVKAIGPSMLRGPKRRLTTTGVNFRPMPLHGSCCLSYEFTWSAKLTLGKQTSQPSLVMVL